MLSSLVRFYGGEGFKNPRNFRNGCVYFLVHRDGFKSICAYFYSSSRWVLSYYQEYKTSEITRAFLAYRSEIKHICIYFSSSLRWTRSYHQKYKASEIYPLPLRKFPWKSTRHAHVHYVQYALTYLAQAKVNSYLQNMYSYM